MEVFMNLPHLKAQLGVDPEIEFKACNRKIMATYAVQGGIVWNTVRVVPELINRGIRILAYSGNADGVCKYMGMEAFVAELPTVFVDEFAGATREKWVVGNRTAGYVRTAGGEGKTAGNQTSIAIYEAGYALNMMLWLIRSLCDRHMAPYNQPEVTLVSVFDEEILKPSLDIGLGHVH
jgi:cathepsin A (carboxypeptidase C)